MAAAARPLGGLGFGVLALALVGGLLVDGDDFPLFGNVGVNPTCSTGYPGHSIAEVGTVVTAVEGSS